MKRRVCCFLLGICILALPAQQVYAAPAGPATKAEEEKPKPHEHPKPHEKKKPHEHEHEKPIPPHEKKPEHPLLPHEHVHEHPKPTVTPAPTEAPKQEADDTIMVDAKGSELVKYALQFVGNPYKYGGTSLTNGADCSGFVQSVFAHFGYRLERTSRDQAKTAGYAEVELKESDLQPGDLIFYANSSGTVYHVAIYIGDGKVVHAANAKKGITISEYTYMKPYKARRIIT